MANPKNLAELREYIARRATFTARGGIRSGYVAVWGGVPANLCGPLAERVIKTQREYSAQYMTGGGRRRMPGHVAYYVTTGDGYVLGYVTADGHAVIAPATEPTARTLAAVHDGLRDAAARQPWHIADDGLHPAGYDDAADSGAVFTVWGRDSRVDVRETCSIGSYTDRDTAYAVMRAFEASGEPYIGPTGYRGTYAHAWIARDDAPVPAGAKWGQR